MIREISNWLHNGGSIETYMLQANRETQTLILCLVATLVFVGPLVRLFIYTTRFRRD